MLTIEQAVEAILKRAKSQPSVEASLHDTLGLVLAEEIIADIDLPPFDKALMDGYAVRSIDLAHPGEHSFRIIEEVTAGQTPLQSIERNEATRIMTGAPLPSGADAVVMHERTRVLDESTVIIPGPVEPGHSMLPRGREMKAGDLLLNPGTRINSVRMGLIASAGRATIQVIPRPTIGIVPTGDELVSPSARPGPGQIRNTNGLTLASMARAWGAVDVIEAAVAPDDPDLLRGRLATALGSSDVLIVSGGVSAGSKDLVPATLGELGVEFVFHQVKVKPGKPIWFGVDRNRGKRPGTLVFGLPGNPASSVVGFLLFVRPALNALAGRTPIQPLLSGTLANSFHQRGDRPTYFPSLYQESRITPLDWAGSADLRTIAMADGFAVFPAGNRTFETGEEVAFLPID